AAHDALVLAPGGRYVFWRLVGPAGSASGGGELIDLAAHSSHALPGVAGVAGVPAFSADGSTVAWIDGSGAVPRLASAPSAGGPVRALPLTGVAAGEIVDLGLSPDGVHVAYSVARRGGGPAE